MQLLQKLHLLQKFQKQPFKISLIFGPYNSNNNICKTIKIAFLVMLQVFFTQMMFERNSKDTRRALKEHTKGTRTVPGHLRHLKHSGTRALEALGHLGTQALKALGYLVTQGTLFSKLKYVQLVLNKMEKGFR